MVVEGGPGDHGLDLDVDEDDVAVGSERHLEHGAGVTPGKFTLTWKVKEPPAGCSASAITDTLLHSTVRRSGRDNTEIVEELDREGSSWNTMNNIKRWSFCASTENNSRCIFKYIISGNCCK